MLVCVFAGMEFASFLRRDVLPSVACLAVPHFSTLPYKLQDFRKNDIEHKMCFGFLYNFSPKCFLFQVEVSRILP